MGVDAEMFVRTRRTDATETNVRRWSVEMCKRFGSGKFFLDKRPWSGDQQRHALSIVPEWEQDGDTVYPEEGETFIRVHLWTRYYGPGYERGDLPFILSVARYLRDVICVLPSDDVWYGGDSSGICAEPLDEEWLWAHFVRVGHDTYRAASGLDREAPPEGTPHCDFCGQFYRRNGWGASFAAYYCDGCGESMEWRDGTWSCRPSDQIHRDGGKNLSIVSTRFVRVG